MRRERGCSNYPHCREENRSVATSWTQEQVLALAPDPASAKAGQGLAVARKWTLLGLSEGAAWGLCQGSGKDPYQAQIDLSEPAFRCSCPSRKFPCKHGIGLLLLLAAQPASFTQGEPPEWVTAWLQSRTQRAEQRTQKIEAKARGEESTVDAAAQAKRSAERERKVAAGLRELQLWLEDLVRRGLAEAQVQPPAFWEGIASRMVDAQAPGLARMLREMSGIPATGEGWPERLLERMSRLHLLIQGYGVIESQDAPTQADLRTRIGWPLKEEEVLAQGEVVRDRWLVVGQRTEQEERLRVQRTWLWGEVSNRPAMILQFAHGAAALDSSLVPGSVFPAELAYYPGSVPLRALVKARQGASEPLTGLPGYPALAAAVDAWTHSLARDPWIEQFPLALQAVTPVRRANGWALRDEEGALLPIRPRWEAGWQLLAVSGGRPLSLFGEWDGDHLLPLSAWAEGRLLRLDTSGGTA
jgi:hypothetical protein